MTRVRTRLADFWARIPGPARVILADPPWKFGDSLPGKGRGAAKHYPLMETSAIMGLELPPVADDAMLLLWRVASMPEAATDVAKAWGFEPKSEIVWVKTTDSMNRKLHFGMGHYVRASHEVCMIATRGSFEVEDRSIRSVFTAPVQAHSQKPDDIYWIAQRLCPDGPHVELFARRPWPGWHQYGNEMV